MYVEGSNSTRKTMYITGLISQAEQIHPKPPLLWPAGSCQHVLQLPQGNRMQPLFQLSFHSWDLLHPTKHTSISLLKLNP